MKRLDEFIPVIFQGGSYGSFLLFCLNNLNTKEFVSPLNDTTGDSHNFKKDHLIQNNQGEYKLLTELHEELDIEFADSKWLKYHPVVEQDQSLKEEIDKLTNDIKKGIFIYPSANHYLLILNNIFDKYYTDDLNNFIVSEHNEDDPIMKILNKHWNISPNTSIENIEQWIKREFLSIYMFDVFEDEYEWNLLDTYTNDNLLIITTYELLYDFENCIKKCASYSGIDTITNLDELVELQKHQLELQKHTDKDRIVNEIIDCFLNNKQLKIPKLNLINESYIQYVLRKNGYEIHCDGLNEFPTDVYSLKEKTVETKQV